MFKFILIFFLLSFNVFASSTRTIDVDGFLSSEHTKSFPLPSTAGTLLHGNGISSGTNLKITYDSNGLITSGTTAATTDLNDVNITSATSGNSLVWNGSKWVNSTISVQSSASAGVNFFLDDTHYNATSSNNSYEVNTLLKTPNTIAQVIDSLNLTNNTDIFETYLYNTSVNGSQIDAGEWVFNIYCSVNSIAAGRVSSITQNIYRVISGANTINTSGSGTTRTATTSASSFVAGDASSTVTASGYLQTPKGVYQITSFNSATSVSILVPSTYTNETSATFSAWKNLFSVNTGAITSIAPSYGLVSIRSAQSAFPINATDKLASIIFGTANNTTTVSFTHNGMSAYSFFSTPLVTRHNDLSAIQGGDGTNYEHLGLNAYNNVNTVLGSTSTVGIANGGTGATTAINALTSLLPSQTGQAGNFLQTNGATTTWASASGGAVLTQPLTGYTDTTATSTASSTLSSSDTILSAFEKLNPSNIIGVSVQLSQETIGTSPVLVGGTTTTNIGDTVGCWSSNKCIVKYTGVYLVTGSVYGYNFSSSPVWNILLYKNGTQAVDGYLVSRISTVSQQQFSSQIKLNAGDDVEIYASTQNGTFDILASLSYCQITLIK